MRGEKHNIPISHPCYYTTGGTVVPAGTQTTISTGGIVVPAGTQTTIPTGGTVVPVGTQITIPTGGTVVPAGTKTTIPTGGTVVPVGTQTTMPQVGPWSQSLQIAYYKTTDTCPFCNFTNKYGYLWQQKSKRVVFEGMHNKKTSRRATGQFNQKFM